MDAVIARLVAATLVAELERGAHVAIGTGLPEDAVVALFERGRAGEFRFLVESGTVGGVPAPGPYFGAAFGPKQIVSTAELFARCRSRLDAACLGALEMTPRVTSTSRSAAAACAATSGPAASSTSPALHARSCFVSRWMRGGEIRVEDGAVRIVRRGQPKLVARVAERCFDAARALRAGKRIFYVSSIGVLAGDTVRSRARPRDAGHPTSSATCSRWRRSRSRFRLRESCR